MDRMMDGMGWGMGIGGLMGLVLVALVIAAPCRGRHQRV